MWSTKFEMMGAVEIECVTYKTGKEVKDELLYSQKI